MDTNAPAIRTPDQRLRVFISSTMKELAAERAAVRDVVTSLRMTPVLFELGARPHPPRELYRAYLEQSDVFVGIYGVEYGWVAPDMKISGIEDEYRLSAGKPRLIYVRDDSDRDERLKAMLNDIANSAELSYKRFSTPDELANLLADDLVLLLSERFQRSSAPAEAPAGVHLPSYAGALIGRERELEELAGLIAERNIRLVTLTGPGGTGKTRLACEAGWRAADRFRDGAHFVPLDTVRDPAIFASALASALGIHEFGSLRLLDTVKAQLTGKEMLLILDNFEQIITAAPAVADLVRDLPSLTVLVTSREPLQIGGEHEFPVGPLAIPEAGQALTSESERLFLNRAKAVRGGFEATGDDTAAIAQICRELDGLPLAIELAAAQVRVLSPVLIRQRLLSAGLDVLGGARRDAPERQRTMRSTIAWSYDLLNEEERRIFETCSVFAGGFTLSAAEAVCQGDRDVLDTLAALTAKSLIRTADSSSDEPRFAMLEMMREFAQERLSEAERLNLARDAHCRYFASYAKRHELTLISPEARRWRFAFEQDYPNLRSAFQWATQRLGDDDFDPEVLVRLLFFLYFFWYLSGRLTEGASLSDSAVRATEGMPDTTARAAALFAMGAMTLWQGDFSHAAELGEASLAIWRKHEGRAHDTATAHLVPCLASLNRGDIDKARPTFEECLRLLRQTGDQATQVIILLHLGDVELQAGKREDARRLYEEGMRHQEALGPAWPIAALENNFGELARYEGDHKAAGIHYGVALDWFQRLESPGNIARTEHNLGYVALREGHLDEAARLFRSALDRFRLLGNRRGTAECLQAAGALAASRSDAALAARLFGASEALFSELGAAPWPADRREAERDLQTVIAVLGEDETERLLEEGRRLSQDEAMALAAPA